MHLNNVFGALGIDLGFHWGAQGGPKWPPGGPQNSSFVFCGAHGWSRGVQEAPKGSAKDLKVTKMTPAS